MEYRVLLLHPVGPHNSPITSQTLFGATCWALAALGEDVGQWLAEFAPGRPPLAFGSAFPYLRGANGTTETVLLLPRPRFRIPAAVVDKEAGATDPERIRKTIDTAKKIQQARYLSAAVSADLQNGRQPGDLLGQVLNDNLMIRAGALLKKAEHDAIWKSTNGKKDKRERLKPAYIQRNSVDRLAGATVAGALFQEEQTFYLPGQAGLWAGVAAEAKLWPKLEAAFRYLADTGLGSERTLGKGHFRFEWQPWESWFPREDQKTAQRFINLGQYIPAAPDEARPLAYELLAIRQKAENRYPTGDRPRVYTAALRAFAPGGIFEVTAAQAVYGQLVELTQLPDRTVYYNGLTLPLWGKWEVGT